MPPIHDHYVVISPQHNEQRELTRALVKAWDEDREFVQEFLDQEGFENSRDVYLVGGSTEEFDVNAKQSDAWQLREALLEEGIPGSTVHVCPEGRGPVERAVLAEELIEDNWAEKNRVTILVNGFHLSLYQDLLGVVWSDLLESAELRVISNQPSRWHKFLYAVQESVLPKVNGNRGAVTKQLAAFYRHAWPRSVTQWVFETAALRCALDDVQQHSFSNTGDVKALVSSLEWYPGRFGFPGIDADHSTYNLFLQQVS